MLKGKRHWVVLAVLALAGVPLAAIWFQREGAQLWVGRDHLLGVDVSHHQGAIDWRKVKRDRIAFAFIKATEGGDFVDSAFADHWRDTKRVEILRGGYHFFTFCKSGELQANNFIQVVPVEPGALPPVVDLELGGNCSARPEPEAFKRELDEFLRRLEVRYGQPAVLYFTQDFYARYGPVLPKRPYFPREVFADPAWLEVPWSFWQFNNAGHVDGIEPRVDVDAFGGSLAELQALTRP